MMRTTAAVLALLLVSPLVVEAQDPVPGERAVHRVTLGETLSHIALEYLGSPYLWPEIFEANRNQIEDPHWIYPWMALVIPGVERPGVVATITVGDREVPMDVEGFMTLEERRRMSQRRPFRPLGVPEYEGERTVFYGRETRELSGPRVLVATSDEIEAVPQGIFHGASWLDPDGAEVPRLGSVTGFAQEGGFRFARTTVHPYDEVQIRFEGTESPEVGDHYLVYRSTDEVRERGRIMVPSGRVEIVRVEEDGAVGRLIQGYDRVQIGHLVTRMRTFPLEPGVHPSPADVQLEARILAFKERRELNLPGDQAFIDLGERDGIAVGDELVGRVTGADGWGERDVARFQVIGVRATTATVRLMHTESPGDVAPGLRLIVDRKMP